MSLQYKFFLIPIKDLDAGEEAFNRFLRTVRLLSIDRRFVENGENSFWALSVEYLESQKPEGSMSKGARSYKKIDYREILSPEDFALYVKLRDWRKETGEKESVPIFTIFTNEQLAKMAQQKIKTLEELGTLTGIGAARVEKYGDDILAVIQGGTCAKTKRELNEPGEKSVRIHLRHEQYPSGLLEGGQGQAGQ